MCGLLGAVISHAPNIKFPAFLKDGFVASSLRGMDSCGIAVIDNKQDLDYHKLPVNGSLFIQDRRARELIDSSNAARTIIMGHTRAATVGKVSMNNAHPFYFNDMEQRSNVLTREFVGCHNGTLTVPGVNPFDTDSEWALDMLMEQGKDAFKKFNGAFAFTWWDSNHPEELNIALNNQRDVHIAKLQNGGLLYASEAGMLSWLAERNQLTIDGPILQLQPLNHYRFNVKHPTKYSKEAIPAYSYTQSNTRTPVYHLTHVENVRELLATVSVSSEAQPDPKGKAQSADSVGKTGAATVPQVHAARNFGLLGVKGEFHALNYNLNQGRTEGIFTAKDKNGREQDYSAVINGYGGGPTLPQDVPWPCAIVGVDCEPDVELLLYLSKPIMSLIPKDKMQSVH